MGAQSCLCQSSLLRGFAERLGLQARWLLGKMLKAPVGHLQEDVQKSEVLLFTLKFHFESELHFKWCGK